MSAIELIGISKKYGDLVAVAPTDLNIEEGELVTLLGPSGSGKSTILSMVAGLTAPTAGRIKIRGRDITDISPSQRNLGLVFQSYALFPHMSVYDNVAFPLSIRGVSKRISPIAFIKSWSGCGWTGLVRDVPASFPAVSNNAWRWRAP